MIGKLGVTTAFAIVWLFTPELFPTPLRAGVTGASSCSARIGGVAASYLATLTLEGQVGSLLPQIVFGGVGLMAGLSALTLPETRKAGLPDSIEDAIQMKRRKPKDTSLGHQNSLSHDLLT
ncbi:solute carrier family 22, member 4 [Plakobranchus ocellatus]|uniref:Solute carrier family 22, member 4 n=1 Tax=Plakobranchus ocellatus TaxID=259542 RepID=A0AAV4AB94_9GAST|nr:solute carrier family 22, member 4 [Plakobranchus ocellatus]